MHTLYILYSKNIDKYYVGESFDAKLRLDRHNEGYYKYSYTSQTNDWGIVLELKYLNKSQAQRIESHIKSMKSKRYIENLLKYEEMQARLMERFK